MKKYFTRTLWTFIIITWTLNIITWITPKNIELSMPGLYTEFKLSNFFEVYEDDYNELSMAKSYMKYSVRNSRTITNKEEVIKRINEVIVKRHPNDENIFWWHTKYIMCYTYGSLGTDFIIIRDGVRSESRYTNYFIHELGHMVDFRKISTYDVDCSDLLKDVSYITYINYYTDWCLGSTLGDYHHRELEDNHKYYTSEHEVYARLNSLKYELVRRMIISGDETITQEHINVFYESCCLSESSEEYIDNMMDYDFMILLPLIDWSRTDILDTI